MLKFFPILIIGFLHFSCFSMSYNKIPLDQHDKATCRDSNWVTFSVGAKGIGTSTVNVDLCQGPVLKMLHIKDHDEPFCLLLANGKCDIPYCNELFSALEGSQHNFINENVEKYIDSERCSVSITSSYNSSNHEALEATEYDSPLDQSVCLLACDLYASGKSFCVFNVALDANQYTLVSGDLLSVSKYVKALSDRVKCDVTEKRIGNGFTKYNYYGVSFSHTGYDAKDVTIRNSNDRIYDSFYRNDIITFFPFVENQTSLFINTTRGSTSCKFSIDSNHSVCRAAPVNQDAIYSHLYKCNGSDFSNTVMYMPAGHNAQEGKICMHRLTH